MSRESYQVLCQRLDRTVKSFPGAWAGSSTSNHDVRAFGRTDALTICQKNHLLWLHTRDGMATRGSRCIQVPKRVLSVLNEGEDDGDDWLIDRGE